MTDIVSEDELDTLEEAAKALLETFSTAVQIDEAAKNKKWVLASFIHGVFFGIL